jgi:hypothetical protein
MARPRRVSNLHGRTCHRTCICLRTYLEHISEKPNISQRLSLNTSRTRLRKRMNMQIYVRFSPIFCANSVSPSRPSPPAAARGSKGGGA